MSVVRCAPSAPAMPLLVLALVVVAASLSSGQVAGSGAVVRTRQGAVRGTTGESSEGRKFHAFYRIPYARPPVGPLRFRNPQPPDSWPHIRDATTPGPVCTQHAALMGGPSPSGAEDCLHLNVFTPQLKPAEPLPVMFWIHGGGWIDGSGNGYGADFLLNHDVVLVTINYRLGPLGFLSTEDSASPGNFGLKDQAAALRWVRENIAAFGGDPGSVTIFGESAGGASVHYHMLSPMSRGLFHRAISQSGVSLTPWGVPKPGGLQKAQKLAAAVGCPTEPSAALVDCLRSVDDYKIVNTTHHFTEWYFSPLIPFRPAVEGEGEESFLPRHPLELKPHTAVPWLTGVTHDEGCLFAAGVAHGDDLFYLFPSNPYYPTSGDMPEQDYEIVKTMTKLWTDFARTGNPTPDNEPVHWPRVTSDGELEYVDIGDQLQVKRGLFQERMDFWTSLPLRETKRSSPAKEDL